MAKKVGVKKLGVIALSGILFLANPIMSHVVPRSVVYAENSQESNVKEILEKRKSNSIKVLEEILKKDYNLKLNASRNIQDAYNRGRHTEPDTVYLSGSYDMVSESLTSVINVLQDEEFKKFYRYASEAYPYDWKKYILDVVKTYTSLGGFDEIESILQEICISNESKYDALLGITAARYHAEQAEFWSVFKKDPKLMAELATISGLDFDYSALERNGPMSLVGKHSKELVEIAKRVGDEEDYILEAFCRIPKKYIKTNPKRLIEIAEQAKIDTGYIYQFINITDIIPDDELVSGLLSLNEHYKGSYKDIEKINMKIRDERFFFSLDYFKDYFKRANQRRGDKNIGLYYYLHNLENSLVLYYAKKHGLSETGLSVLKDYFIDASLWIKDGESLLVQKPSLENYKTLSKLNKDAAHAFIKAYQNEPQLHEGIRENIFYMMDWQVRSLTSIVNLLHDNKVEREKIVSSLSPETIYFAIAQGDEVFTSSFNLFYDNLAYKLEGGEGILPQDNRTEQQQRKITNGKEKILDFITETDKEEKKLTRFLLTTSYFGRLHEIVPKEKVKQEEFLDKLLHYVIRKDDAFYLAPTFEAIFTRNEAFKKTFEDLLFKNYEQEKRQNKKLIYGLIVFTQQYRMSEENKERAEIVVKELKDNYGIKITDLEVPKEWFAQKGGELNLKFKLYFQPETENDNVLRPAHLNLMAKELMSKGYSRTTNQKSEVILTKTKTNKKGRKVKLEFILSNRKNLRYDENGELAPIEEDILNPEILLLGHRGHSYQLDNMFNGWRGVPKGRRIPKKVVYDGSCGGFNSIPRLDRYFNGRTQFIATKNMGIGMVNNIILYELAEALSEEPELWSEVYKVVKEKVDKRESPKISKMFKDFSFPGDLPSLILKYAGSDEYY